MSPKSKSYIKDLTFSAMFLAIGLVLPFFTGSCMHLATCSCPCICPYCCAG